MNPREQFEINYRRQLFEQKFERKGQQECWPWKAAKIKAGHGIFGMGQLCEAPKPAYVAAWFFFRDMSLDLDAPLRFHHLCGDTGCVNPAHLIIFGPGGVENDQTVLEFIAHRHPKLRAKLGDLGACL